MREHGEDGFTRRTLEPPDGDPAEADTGVMGVAGQASPPAARRLVCGLEGEREDEGQHTFDKGPAHSKEPQKSRFGPENNRDGPGVAGSLSGVCRAVPPNAR